MRGKRGIPWVGTFAGCDRGGGEITGSWRGSGATRDLLRFLFVKIFVRRIINKQFERAHSAH